MIGWSHILDEKIKAYKILAGGSLGRQLLGTPRTGRWMVWTATGLK
jgi:hypothetical protein